MKKLFFIFGFIGVFALNAKSKDSTTFPERRHFIGSSAFMVFNLLPNPPGFYQLNAGRWLTHKDVVSVEAKTWSYQFPLGIPYGDDFENPAYEYPGKARGIGMGAVYQRFIWKGFYAAIHNSLFYQRYTNKEKQLIGEGVQLFQAFRLGYHIKMTKNRFFLEPSLAVTHWPINTGVPESFKAKDKDWPNYFLFEPGLHFGYKF